MGCYQIIFVVGGGEEEVVGVVAVVVVPVGELTVEAHEGPSVD